MAREPHYPDDAAIGGRTPASSSHDDAPSLPSTPAPRGRGSEGTRKRKMVKGAAIGIGSAAIVAALLYANRRGKNDKGNG